MPATGDIAQGSHAPDKPARRTLYFNAKGQQIASSDSAEHREEMLYRDSVGDAVRVYYPSGKLRRVVPYLHFGRGIKYGVETSFYETGEIKSRSEFNLDGPVGPYVQFYRNGNVRTRVNDRGGLLGEGKGESFAPDGKPRVFSAHIEKMPTLGEGGSAAIVAAVQRRVSYPVEALRTRVTGRVFVTFMVDDAGFVRNVRITKSDSPLFNAAVLQAVASLARLTPGEMDGDTVDVFFTVPITFAIR